jgi:GNAT superfamily N-acetyltransferase
MVPLTSFNPYLLTFVLVALWVPLISGLIRVFFNDKTSFFDLSNTWYIKCQGRLVAWVTLHRNPKDSEIKLLFVEKNWRRRGLGSALVKRLIQEAHPPILLGCSHKLVSFYSRLGFVRYGSNIFGGQYMVYKGLEKR